MEGKTLLKHMAQKNWRGVSIPNLICELQAYQDELKDSELVSPRDDTDDWVYYCNCAVEAIQNELKRREKLRFNGITRVNENVIQTIKEKLGSDGLIDIIESYTEVFVRNGYYTFKCNIHGNDKYPSGKIYPDQPSWWCFGCNKGGDVFDAVQHFERVDLITAIKKLAKYVGLDIKPTNKAKGGAEITLKDSV